MLTRTLTFGWTLMDGTRPPGTRTTMHQVTVDLDSLSDLGTGERGLVEVTDEVGQQLSNAVRQALAQEEVSRLVEVPF